MLARATYHARVASEPYDFPFGVLACLCALSLELWRCVLELHTILTGILNGGLQLWTLLAAAAAAAATAAA